MYPNMQYRTDWRVTARNPKENLTPNLGNPVVTDELKS